MPRLSSAKHSLQLVLVVLLFPLWFSELLWKERRSPYNDGWAKKRRAELAPTPLPKKRRCKLTLKGDQSHQTQHPLLKLPLEIRQRIYEHVLVGGKPLVHINQSFKKLVHCRCSKQIRRQTCKDNTACFHGILVGPRDYYDGDDPDTYIRSDGGILPLLKSCRQIYSESVEMVYKLHVFSFKGFEAFLYFVDGILLSRLNVVRSLEIQVIAFPSVRETGLSPCNLDTGTQAWAIVAKMKGLSNLTVIIEPGNQPVLDAEEEAAYLGPLKQIQQVADYEVCLNWKKESWRRDSESGPYRITRPIPPSTTH